MNDDLKYKVALSMLPNIGGILARNLVAYIGSAEAVFSQSAKALTKVPGIGELYARQIKKNNVLPQAEKELEYIDKNGIGIHFYTDKTYPRRLKNCVDAPLIIYTKGNMNLDAERVISIVGTRNATEYGRSIVDDLCREFAERKYKILIVSGLAYGIDVQAHRSALNHNLPTVGVIAHGLDLLYPALHKQTAEKMQESGGIVTDFPSNTKIDPANFIKRNRIIAGLADATIVVESAKKGGSLITADIASSYNRDVFAFPGRAGDTYSKGCNQLIRNNGATLIEGINDLEYFMGWEKTDKVEAVQSSLFIDLNPEEQKVVDLLKEKGDLFIDQISAEIKLPVSRISAMLLNLEFKNVVLALPGKMYKLR
ncbi:DNA-processing protein DprA [Draconibacterium sp. IB214405]|uniref:DNA-processing protein DprA n=1 Tax=Draconibacterium sp. IB214405 TaxID=3097352 RepID=UPI002A129527|nr:DNA-processing protein DprA [Draconibacterium sp. IB214405]MDX8338548.1 DNA-processing protein DprA [Draconibacterium sp. IB214405]